MGEYEQIDAIRWSRLKALRISPLQYRYEIEAESKESPAMRFGSAVHMRVLEPQKYHRQYVVWPGARHGKAWLEFRDAHQDSHEILTDIESRAVSEAAHAVLTHTAARRLLSDGVAEQHISWTDPVTGLRCKAKPDFVGRELVELKTSGEIAPSRFGATVARLGYHGQLAFYLDGLRENGHRTRNEAAIIAVQSTAPFDVIVFRAHEDVIEQGRQLYRSLLRQLLTCIERDEWPGAHPADEVSLCLPAWADEDTGPELQLTMGGLALEV